MKFNWSKRELDLGQLQSSSRRLHYYWLFYNLLQIHILVKAPDSMEEKTAAKVAIPALQSQLKKVDELEKKEAKRESDNNQNKRWRKLLHLQ